VDTPIIHNLPNPFKFRKKSADFRSKLLKSLEIAHLGLFLPFVPYVVGIKPVNSIGFVFPPLPFSLPAIVGFRFCNQNSRNRLMACEFRILNPDP